MFDIDMYITSIVKGDEGLVSSSQNSGSNRHSSLAQERELIFALAAAN